MSAVDYCKNVLNLPLSFEIENRPYRLLTCLPDDQLQTAPRSEFLKRKMGSEKYECLVKKTESWAEERNIPNICWDGPLSQSTRAHRLSRKAYLMGGQTYQQPLLMALYKGYFEQEKDIADINVLSDIAEEVGLMTKDDALQFFESGELKDDVDVLIANARQNGVSGVPLTIIENKWVVNGSQKADVFIQIFKKLATCTGPCTSKAPLPGTAMVAATYA